MFENMGNADSRLSFDEFKEIVEYIYALNKVSEEYTEGLRKVDSALAEYLDENSKMELLYRINDKLMVTVFGDMIEDVFWLLYEWKVGTGMEIETTKKYTINNLEDYFNYIRDEYYLPKTEPFILPETEAEVKDEPEIYNLIGDGGIMGKIKRMFGL